MRSTGMSNCENIGERTRGAAQKLGLVDPEDVYTMDRPKGMHKRTFQRLRRMRLMLLNVSNGPLGL